MMWNGVVRTQGRGEGPNPQERAASHDRVTIGTGFKRRGDGGRVNQTLFVFLTHFIASLHLSYFDSLKKSNKKQNTLTKETQCEQIING
mmetsp:Transcript_44596/g.53593  ORF Transcript_44596/g.53593 Transcript_44596/m.53593 type:complete len:89 (+) Transcript_44596:3151-3417(+)